MMAKRQLSIVDFCNAKRSMQHADDHSESESEPSISDSENLNDDVDSNGYDYEHDNIDENENVDDDHSYCRPQCRDRETRNSLLFSDLLRMRLH